MPFDRQVCCQVLKVQSHRLRAGENAADDIGREHHKVYDARHVCSALPFTLGQVADSKFTAVQLPVDTTQQAGDKTMANWMAWAEEQLIKRNPVNKGAEQVWDSLSKVTSWTYHGR